ncbi:terpene synthase family protein [Nocardia nova]|uniref:terpene synthase family protein n=1 Tax=Nocardia nova TaxID=37330 RepID=UPI003400E7A7
MTGHLDPCKKELDLDPRERELLTDLVPAFELGLPFRCHRHADAEASRLRVLRWVRDRGLFASDEAFDWFAAWHTSEFVANAYPRATPGEGMDLVGRFMAVTIVLDDELDELRSPTTCVHHIRPYLDIVACGGEHLPAAADRPLHAAVAEVIRDCRARADDRWWARAATAWQASLFAIANEVTDRRMRRGPAPRDIHLAIRRAGGFMIPFLDVVEPAAGGGIEPAAVAYHSAHLIRMRHLVVDLGDQINDLYSLPKELARGQTNNLVMVVSAETGQPIPTAARTVAGLVEAHARRLRDLRGELPQLCDALELSVADRDRTLGYGDALLHWVAGYQRWHRASPRYRDALIQRPPAGPWAYADLNADNDSRSENQQ